MHVKNISIDIMHLSLESLIIIITLAYRDYIINEFLR